MIPVSSYSCSVTSGTRKSPMENHRLELFASFSGVCPKGAVACCVCLRSCGLRSSSPCSDIPYRSGGRGVFREILWDFLVGSLIALCLFAVWSGVVGWGVLGMLA